MIIPADFAEHAKTETIRQLADRYHVGSRRIEKMIKEAGIVRPTKIKPVPANFVEMAKIYTMSELALHYDVSQRVIERFYSEAKLPRPGAKVSRPAPDDFVRHARQEINAELAIRYSVVEKTISRWRRETQTQRESPKLLVSKHLVSSPNAPRHRNVAYAPEAARYLQKIYCPVYHRIIIDRDEEGLYMVGNRIMPAEDMVELAVEKGF